MRWHLASLLSGTTEEGADDFDDALNTDGITIDDPVKVYLKEIGRAPMCFSSPDRIFLPGVRWNQICESTAFWQISGMCRRLSDGFLCGGSIFLVYVQPEC